MKKDEIALPPPPYLNQQQTLRLAWATLLGACGIAFVMLFMVVWLLWSYRMSAMNPHSCTLFLRAPVELVAWQRKGHTIFEQVRDQQLLDEGGRLSIAHNAGYGQAATIRLPDLSTIDMWAGAELLLQKVQTSRWNNRKQEIVLRQIDGYIRYDLRDDQPYEKVLFHLQVGDSWITFEPGGSYSVEIKPNDRNIYLPGSVPFEPTIVDVAVRSGHARVHKRDEIVSLADGQRVVIDPTGAPSAPMPAVWQLVRDGQFSAYSEEEYNNTTLPDQPALPRATTWNVFSGPEDAGASGFFGISKGCKPPRTDNDCPRNEQQKAAWFIRNGRQNTGFTTGVVQFLGHEQTGVDISEYRSLVFSAWVRILYQSVELAGVRGTECPVMVRFVAKEKKPDDPEEERVICVYTSDDPTQQPERAPGIVYYRAERYAWEKLRIELRDSEWLPEARYLWNVRIYANGHDYDSRVTNVSLVGSHAANTVPEHIEGTLSVPEHVEGTLFYKEPF